MDQHTNAPAEASRNSAMSMLKLRLFNPADIAHFQECFEGTAATRRDLAPHAANHPILAEFSLDRAAWHRLAAP